MHSQKHDIKALSVKHVSLLNNNKMAVFLVCSDLFCGEVCLTVVFLLCEDDGENCMGPAAGLIHVGGSHSSVG